MNTISNFHSSLYILHDSHENLETIFFLFNQYPKSGMESLANPFLPSVRNYILLEAVSFIDEYENNFIEINNKITKTKSPIPKHLIEKPYWSRIEDLHRVVKPLLNTLNRWTEIKEYRNNYVGHGSRASYSKGNKLKIAGQEEYDAPRSVFEFQIMRDIIHLIFGLIAQEFKMELIDAEYFANTLKPGVNPLKDNSHIVNELSSMILESEGEFKKQGKDYSLNILQLSYEPLKKWLHVCQNINTH